MWKKTRQSSGRMANAAIVQAGYNKEDPLSTLKLVTKPIPNPSPPQVVVRVTLRPVNPTDFLTIRCGSIAGSGDDTPGSEGFGIVHEVGKGVTKFHKGQRVVPITGLEVFKGNGSFQEYVCIDEELVWPVPDYMSDEAAAQFVINPWTSYTMLKDLEAPRGEFVIQSAAGSTLGKQVIRLAKHWGIKTINVVRRAEQKAELMELGADEVICSSDEDVVARVKKITAGKGAWGALDAVCGTMTQTLASCVRDGGVIFIYGVLGGFTLSMATADVFRDVSVRGWGIYHNILPSPERCHACAAEVAPLIRDGIIPTAHSREKFDLSDFRQALQMAEQPGRSGKVFLVSL